MGNSSISTLMGPTGPRGATAPDGSVGASGNTGSTGTTGNTGSTGAGISGSAGVTNCNQRLLKNKDGQYFVIGPIQGATGSPSGGVDGVVCDSCSAGFDCPLGSYCCCGHSFNIILHYKKECPHHSNEYLLSCSYHPILAPRHACITITPKKQRKETQVKCQTYRLTLE